MDRIAGALVIAALATWLITSIVAMVMALLPALMIVGIFAVSFLVALAVFTAREPGSKKTSEE